MDQGRRGLPDNASGRLEDRAGRVVRRVQELKAGRKDQQQEEEEEEEEEGKVEDQNSVEKREGM